MVDDSNNSCDNSEALLSQLSQLSQSSKRRQLDEEFEKRKEVIEENTKISQDGIFNNIFYDRKDAIDYLKNVFGGDKTLNQYGRNGHSINLKCSNDDCCFRIVCKRFKSKKENPFIFDQNKSKLLHAIIDDSSGKTIGLCNSLKKVTVVYFIYLLLIYHYYFLYNRKIY